VTAVREGRGGAGRAYASRYVCSLVADVHFVLAHGGVAMNPRAHLRVLYEAAPLAMVVEQAGGAATDGVGRVLDVRPAALHERRPLFLGSREDVAELLTFGDVRQLGDFSYAAVK